eukprot:jgi/Chlat1/9104/Chrsp97S09275
MKAPPTTCSTQPPSITMAVYGTARAPPTAPPAIPPSPIFASTATAATANNYNNNKEAEVPSSKSRAPRYT